MDSPAAAAQRQLMRAQAAYYAVTGVWPLLSIGTFQKVTGPKHDLWLVKTVGVLVAAIGGALWLAARKEGAPSEEAVALAAGSAAGLAAIDIVYPLKRVISPIYLADALVELGLVGAWAALRLPRTA